MTKINAKQMEVKGTERNKTILKTDTNKIDKKNKRNTQQTGYNRHSSTTYTVTPTRANPWMLKLATKNLAYVYPFTTNSAP